MTMRDDTPDWQQSASVRPAGAAESGGGPDARQLTDIIELMFFAYRDFTGEADNELSGRGFGRAHHRVIYFVSRHPGLTVTDLLAILKITKQSLARVLKQLIDEGYIAQKSGEADKRQRLLYATRRGRDLAVELTELQMVRIQAALAKLDETERVAVRQFLFGMISADEQCGVAALMAPGRAAEIAGRPARERS